MIRRVLALALLLACASAVPIRGVIGGSVRPDDHRERERKLYEPRWRDSLQPTPVQHRNIEHRIGVVHSQPEQPQLGLSLQRRPTFPLAASCTGRRRRPSPGPRLTTRPTPVPASGLRTLCR